MGGLMGDIIFCPFCDKDFEGRMWESGECPYCNEGYDWDEVCTDDYSDCWAVVEWEKFDRDEKEKPSSD